MAPELIAAPVAGVVRYRISRQTFLWITLFTVVIVSSATTLYQVLMDAKIDHISQRHLETLQSSAAILGEELASIRQLVRILHGTMAKSNVLQSSDTRSLQDAAIEFSKIARNIPSLAQIRWLDQHGEERVRLNIDDHDDLSTGGSSIVPQAQLQDKYERYYFQRGWQQQPPSVYLSAIDLNMENGVIEQPLRPTLRATYRTGIGDGMQDGLLVINYDLSRVLSVLRALSQQSHSLQILNAEGYWIMHPDAQREWGLQLGREQQTLAAQLPDTWAVISQRRRFSAVRTGLILDRQLWSFITLLPHDLETAASTDAPESLHLLMHAGSDELLALRARILTPIIIIAVLLFIFLLFMLSHELSVRKKLINMATRIQHDKQKLLTSLSSLEASHEQEQLLQAELLESRKLSALGLAVAGVAHDINTPAGGASITTDILLQKVDSMKQQMADGIAAHDMEDFIEQSATGLQLVKSQLEKIKQLVRSYKRLAVERNTPQPQRFKLYDNVADLLTVLQPSLRDKGIKFEIDIDRELEIESLPGVISQLLQNLIMNAAAHAFATNRGNTVSITTHRKTDGLEIMVADNGAGIAPELIEIIFDPFATSKRGAGHSGLGLYMVHQWVTLDLRGQLQVASTIDEGTRFSIDIPL